MKTTILLGPPGTGKTTSLINLLSEYLDRGIKPNRIGFLSFTKQATEEARGRAMARFGFKENDLPYFRTLHSLAFRQLGMNTKQVMGRAHYKELGKRIGVEIAGTSNPEDGDAYGLPKGDRLLFLSGLARVRCESLQETWEDVGEDLDFREVEQFDNSLREYKLSSLLVDFTDMLTAYEKAGPFPELDVLFVDEAQDLSQLQWRIVKKLSDCAGEVYLAGDDDQSIFRWSGADIATFIDYPGAARVLDQSYRLPPEVQKFAVGLLGGIRHRREKTFSPASHKGSVTFQSCLEDVDLSSGEWLILIRNGYQAKPIEEFCRDAGYHYSWKGKSPGQSEAVTVARLWERRRAGKIPLTEDEEAVIKRYHTNKAPDTVPWYDALNRLHPEDIAYIRAASRRGEKLSGAPRIRISTIHGAKGGEAQNVLLFTDMSYKTFEGYQKDPDDESRVFYVGATRAKENLHVVLPQTGRFFEV